MVLIYRPSNEALEDGRTCFRPLAGIMVLISEDDVDIGSAAVGEFPSPCGDYGSYLCLTIKVKSALSTFPSPCGDYGSYH